MTNDGGPAFPVRRVERTREPIPGFPGDTGESTVTHSGMTLRDYFAAKAMAAMVARCTCSTGTPEQLIELMRQTAYGAYLYADAMLAEREK